MTPVLDNPITNNAVATLRAYVDAFMEQHEGKEFPYPMGEYQGQMGTVVEAYYRMEKGGSRYRSKAHYGDHGLMIKLRGEVKTKRGSKETYAMTYHAQDIEGVTI